MKKKTPLRLWYTAEAPKINECSKRADWRGGSDIGWERWSLPIGNGYFGANVFGRTDTERIQITDKTLQNPPTLVKDKVTYFVGGLTSFSETYIDFGHKDVSDYKRYLDIETAIAGVEYTFGGVKYSREYFTSYPHRALVIKLDADKSGALTFTLRPTNPYKQSYGGYEGDGVSRSGIITSYTRQDGVGVVDLAGRLDFYGFDFFGTWRVYTKGGEIWADTVEDKYTDTDGTEKSDLSGVIRVKGADCAFIVATLDSDYELSSDVFTTVWKTKPMHATGIDYAKQKVEGYARKIEEAISCKSFDEAYNTLRSSHVADHSRLFGRVELDLGASEEELAIPTDELLQKYRDYEYSKYLETLIFQYGRYLLIASSRPGTMPAHLQGAWNTYDVPPWSCGYWHNINVQMNYWPAFSTNLAETFEAYVGYKNAYMKQAKIYADAIVKEHHPESYGKDGGNGWVIGTDGHQVSISTERSAGNLGFTTQLFWEYYLHTMDKRVLAEAYDLLVDAARYITKCTVQDENGNYLVAYGDSPEMHVGGVWYRTKGTAYAQAFAYMNNYNALLAAKEMGIDLSDSELLSKEEYSVLKTVMDTIDKYDPVVIGLSGQIKEFREEDYYCSFGDEYHHRHISQAVGLYPASFINGTTPAWLDAATVSLDMRGNGASGWGLAHRLNARARTKDGEKAYVVLENLIARRTAENLWNLHPPFQIDGSFGLTAGISEMLLQSHEGYIEPLAAIPSDWESGSFSGLVARGGFEVSAEWESGAIKSLKLISTAGGRVSVRYPRKDSARIIFGGKEIEYTAGENHVISFDTEKGGEYSILGEARLITASAPEGLYLTNENGAVTLVWERTSAALRYNVYKAEESAPTYTLLGSTEGTSFADPDACDTVRTTYAVTSVGEDGIESKRALCYRNPEVRTEYGLIPADESHLPFALFEKCEGGYDYIGSYASFSKALGRLWMADEPVIYLTRDAYCDTEGIEDMLPGKYTVDLGGRKLMLDGDFIPLDVRGMGTDVTVKNGALLTMSGSVISASCSRREADGRHKITFSGVTFGNEKYCEKTVPLFKVDPEIKASGVTVDITLLDCTLDYLTIIEANKATLFDLFGKEEGVTFNLNMRGGLIKIRNFGNLDVLPEKRDANFLFVKNASGNAPSFKITSFDEPTVTFPTEEGERGLKLVERTKIHHTVYSDYVFEE